MKLRFLACAVALALCFGTMQAQVVADSACEKYAVDIAAFATCDSPTRVARAETEENEAVAPSVDSRTPETRPSKERDAKKADAKPSAKAGR